jgi:hypothetical protein
MPPATQFLEESGPQPVSAAPEALSPDLARQQYLPANPVVPERLFRRLLGFRSQLADVWSAETIHPSYDFEEKPGPKAPDGQCGVSSAWILWKFGSWYRFRAKYCYGDIIIRGATEPNHCWIEMGNARSARRLVIDVTCDQFKIFEDTPVLLDRHARLTDQAIEYRADSRRSFRSLKVEKDHVLPRFETLRELTDPSTATTGRRSTVGAWLRWRESSTSAVPAD